MNLTPSTAWGRAIILVGLLLVATTPPEAAAALAADRPALSDLVERVWPSVVTIRTRERSAPPAPAGRPVDPTLDDLLRRHGIPMPGGGHPPLGDAEAPRQNGIASGFLFTADGYLMTNSHVVDNTDELTVTLTDEREFKAQVIGVDRRTDVAVLKIDAGSLTPVKIGDTGRMRVGDWVIAIGSPFGLANSVTAGIVSAKARDTGDFLPLIQTDVAINPGNSGGPLINLDGEVVGINSQIYSRSGGFMGISFAIPIDEAVRVADQLRTQGHVVRGRIGVRIANVEREVAQAIGLPRPAGAMVQSVETDGPADKGGVLGGDIITRVSGRDVARTGDLQRILGGTAPGTEARIEVYRLGRYQELKVAVGEFAAEPQATPVALPPGPVLSLGLQVSDRVVTGSPTSRQSGGVVVDGVDGMAARAGIRGGDILLAVANIALTDARHFQTVVGQIDHAKPTGMLVQRGDVVNFLVVQAWK
jgi:serine protease Do